MTTKHSWSRFRPCCVSIRQPTPRPKSKIQEVEDSRNSGARNQRTVDEWVDLLHGSTYQGAAHSLATPGMIVPLYSRCSFKRSRTSGRGTSGHRNSAESSAQRVDQGQCVPGSPFCVQSRLQETNKDLAVGILGLAEAIGLALPSDFGPIFSALYRYCNKMFHFGFQWTVEGCRRRRGHRKGRLDYLALNSHARR